MTRLLMTRGFVAAVLTASLCVAATASAQEDNSPLSAIGRMFGKSPSQQTSGQDEAGTPTTDQVLRIERLETQIRQMTGNEQHTSQDERRARDSHVSPF